MKLSNRLFDEIAIGDRASIRRVCTEADLYVFANVSGNLNPANLPDLEARFDTDGDPGTGAVAPSMWLASLIGNVIGTRLPGPGALYRAQTLVFRDRARVGDELQVTVTVADKREPRLLLLDTRIERLGGTTGGQSIAEGQAEVFAPQRRIEIADAALPEVLVRRHEQFDRLLAACAGLPPLPTAVVCPDDPASLEGALQARDAGLIAPVLVGAEAGIRETAADLERDLSGVPIVNVTSDEEAARRAIALAREGRVRAVMKGHLHTDTLLAAIVRRDDGLRTGRRISHVYAMDLPGIADLLFISDAAINIAPDLQAKVDIVQNAIDLARACGLPEPRVGILSAVETVTPTIPSTIDAAVLSKMAERGQITGGLVDGPLAMDNAVDLQAARTKGIASLVAGRAQVLIVPNLESGNMLAKELTFLAHAEAAGLVLGAQVPVMLTSRADDARSRLVSCALAQLHDWWRAHGSSRVAGAGRAD
ncbi:bifunctional enoyl-CoA hydratase/phosphate acetyltransferase [Zeimonas arvi]|uniref:Bifunctional enoyl-CoA hydratase/phosphate acetyltransferase n=1 Tax=Zeimonas arvi TaxID=2498847 RepID=A0A5C8NWK1_9BURK|nr:bifunctional enoyl-CoA hydratase/phosphate acetyltransferase [Zeimonas arvi]TXL65442.1 bifunctional enoyl-CoA hydratase/phosphate acetyltransferase [Zeimonas arvi]